VEESSGEKMLKRTMFHCGKQIPTRRGRTPQPRSTHVERVHDMKVQSNPDPTFSATNDVHVLHRLHEPVVSWNGDGFS
jgi:hypothetical protein